MLTQITCSDCGVCCRVYVAFKPYFSCLRQLLLVEFGGSPQIPLNWLTLSTPLQNGTAIFTYNCGVLKEHFPSAGTRDTECQQQNPQQFESVFCPWLRALKVKNVQFSHFFPHWYIREILNILQLCQWRAGGGRLPLQAHSIAVHQLQVAP